MREGSQEEGSFEVTVSSSLSVDQENFYKITLPRPSIPYTYRGKARLNSFLFLTARTAGIAIAVAASYLHKMSKVLAVFVSPAQCLVP